MQRLLGLLREFPSPNSHCSSHCEQTRVSSRGVEMVLERCPSFARRGEERRGEARRGEARRREARRGEERRGEEMRGEARRREERRGEERRGEERRGEEASICFAFRFDRHVVGLRPACLCRLVVRHRS